MRPPPGHVFIDATALHGVGQLDGLAASLAGRRGGTHVLVSDAVFRQASARRGGTRFAACSAVIEVARALRDAEAGPCPSLALRPFFHGVPDALDVLGQTLGARPEFAGSAPDAILADLVARAGERPFDSLWALAYVEARPCALVLPTIGAAGCLMGLGVVPWARRRGYGRGLHRHALGALAAAGATRYRDHVDRDDGAMRRICRANGCEEVQTLWQVQFAP